MEGGNHTPEGLASQLTLYSMVCNRHLQAALPRSGAMIMTQRTAILTADSVHNYLVQAIRTLARLAYSRRILRQLR